MMPGGRQPVPEPKPFLFHPRQGDSARASAATPTLRAPKANRNGVRNCHRHITMDVEKVGIEHRRRSALGSDPLPKKRRFAQGLALTHYGFTTIPLETAKIVIRLPLFSASWVEPNTDPSETKSLTITSVCLFPKGSARRLPKTTFLRHRSLYPVTRSTLGVRVTGNIRKKSLGRPSTSNRVDVTAQVYRYSLFSLSGCHLRLVPEPMLSVSLAFGSATVASRLYKVDRP